MTYSVEISETYRKSAKKIDRGAEKIILKWLNKNIHGGANPRNFGKPLVGGFQNLWGCRVGAYIVIVGIQDDKLIVLAINVGHR